MTLKEFFKKRPSELIQKAYAFAEAAHQGQKRRSGEPYFSHSAAVAETLHNWHMDDATIAAGLLHDTVEDTGTPLTTIKEKFGEEVAFLVDGVTKLGKIKYHGAEGRAENIRKMFLALSQDLRVVFIKLADRLHNMKTLGALPPAKQKRIALETDEIYAPLAYRLGMQNLSGDLQDLAFPYLHPREHRWLLQTTKERYEERLKYLEKVKPEVEGLLKKHGVKATVIDVRAKRYSSLYKKLLRHDMEFDKIYDLVAMRIIVKNIPDCYAALGVIHEKWPPLPGRIKDYIAMPKPNSYRSLHTTVIGPDEKIIEFQIRTKDMHDENEYGIAAHWLYKQKKDGKKITGENIARELTWIGQLRDWQEKFFSGYSDPGKFLQAMKFDFFRDRIFAVTPHGDVVDLPAGATLVDFAYHIHSEVGNTCTGAKVNGTIVPLDEELKSGDMVEIITQKGKKPSEDWLKFVKTSGARDHIKAELRGRNHFAARLKLPTRCELKIAVDNRVGLIKDISTALARNHMNILNFRAESAKGGRYSFDKVEVESTDKEKIERLIVKLKRIDGVKEVSYRIV